jgi:hypothetical protein
MFLGQKFYLPHQPQDGHAGVLISADRGREDRSAKELIDLFDEVAELYFPKAPAEAQETKEEPEENISLESELAKELSLLKKRKKKQSKRFQPYVTFFP